MTITETPTTTAPATRLDESLLERCRDRAAGYDRDNSFFHEDLDELRAAGYLRAAVPTELGGWGLDLVALAAEQRRLARYAPATALALSMHHYWVGTAADLWRAGDRSSAWILTDAVDGHVFASGHAEAGNDLPVVLSTTMAERVEGGYRFSGRKMFGSLTPVWTRLGIHALDGTAADGPSIVHAFLARTDPGHHVVETWDTLGMRATQSHDTVLDGCVVPDERVARVVAAGETSDPFVAVMQLWALTLISNVYAGIGERSLELAIDAARRRTSIALERGSMAYHPMIQHRIAEMALELEALTSVLDRLAGDWVSGVDHGDGWGVKVLAAKSIATEGAKRVVDIALDVSGGSGMFRGSELERLYRDVRCGGFHPGNHAFTHEVIGKALLGVGQDGPRW